ncbi:hypothetical protein [Arthrospiribacter ruber]|uniref:Uncharacterized protein n=1 Tax=Arthrospiribacter ruber TaxID=2487934 RepID=A0A951IVX4_9BACT|nr:hypothetical protein [Arthrospiribacter ruber]MBW3467057.1 hypothetical protein [Arthrospiribacter ruber]
MQISIESQQEILQLFSPDQDQVRNYFRQNDYPLEEADVFFFYYQSLGWRNENGTPLRDWKLAASSWMWNLEN